jgi:hypothetical protein
MNYAVLSLGSSMYTYPFKFGIFVSMRLGVRPPLSYSLPNLFLSLMYLLHYISNWEQPAC